MLHVEQEVVGDDTTALESVLQCDTVREELLRKEREISVSINHGYVFARIKHLNCVHTHLCVRAFVCVCACVCARVCELFYSMHSFVIYSFLCLPVSCIYYCLVCLFVTSRLQDDIMLETDSFLQDITMLCLGDI